MGLRRYIGLGVLLAILGANAYMWQRRHAQAEAEAHLDHVVAAAKARENPTHEILLREIVRQAWLVAARDGMGLPTRDALLREPPLRGPEAVPDVLVQAYINHDCEITVMGPDGAPPPAGAWHMVIPPEQWKDGYRQLIETCEKLSRGAFVDGLKSTGLKGRPNAPHQGPAPDLAKAAQQLEPMNYFAQFTAVRLAHASMRTDGESPEALDVLVRGYAHLAILSQGLWNATYRGMVARSMIYAQRMLATAPAGDVAARRSALQHRAYALAAAGLQGSAVEDLEAASKLQPPGATQPADPDWVAVLDAYCHYQTHRLADFTASLPGDRAQLPAFLAYLTIEHTASPSALNQFGRAVLQGEPDNQRVIEGMCFWSGVAALHELTLYALQATAQKTTERIPDLSGVPPAVIAAAKHAAASNHSPESMAAVSKALVDAGAADRGEPSWAALGRLLQDTGFRNVERRVRFEARGWAVDPRSTEATLFPLVADHPYAPAVKLLAADNQSAEARHAIIKDMKVVDSQGKMLLMLDDLDRNGLHPVGLPTWNDDAQGHRDGTTIEGELLYSTHTEPDIKARIAKVVKETAPAHPIVIADEVANDWPEASKHLDEIAAEADQAPLIAGALGTHYSKAKDWPQAEKYLRKYIDVCKDLWAYEQLGRNYLAQGDEEHMVSTIQEFLKEPDYRLDHAQANVDVARYYMKHGQYDKAEPFADAAAQSWAGWAMDVAIECERKLGHEQAAKTWERRRIERYGK